MALLTENEVVYCFSHDYVKLCDRFEKDSGRASVIHSLVGGYCLNEKMRIYCPISASRSQLTQYHANDYISFIEKLDQIDIECDQIRIEGQEFGFGFDCPISKGLASYVMMVADASLYCAKAVCQPKTRVAINWGGGWHHATQSNASGFCYINDCVLTILKLREHFDRVLYLDIDAHHGDAVQDAFSFSNKVFTVSFHKFEPGFYPGTGRLSDIGCGKGRGYTMNIPFKEGLTDSQFISVIDRFLPTVLSRFRPNAIVMQCGADGLSCDPVQAFNLTPASYLHVLRVVLDSRLPTVVLGGGGYNKANTARCWVQMTAEIVGEKLNDDIPENSHFPIYGPDFCLEMKSGKLKNYNTQPYLDEITEDLIGIVKSLFGIFKSNQVIPNLLYFPSSIYLFVIN